MTPESEHNRMTPTPFQPRQLISAVIDELAPVADSRGNHLRQSFGPGIPERLFSNTLNVRLILNKLVRNANKFTQNGIISVSANFDGSSELVKVLVMDTGPGIPMSRLHSIFRNHTVVAAQRNPDRITGPCLYQCRKLARALGGDIKLVQSASERGAVFSFSFVGLSLRPGTPDNHHLLKGKRILLADDCEDIRVLYKLVLSAQGAVVHCAADGQEAIRMAKTQDYDLALLDIRMPDMDGIATLRELRRNGYSGPVLSLSGDQFFLNDQAPAFNGSLTKPMSKYEIVDAVSSHLSNP